MNLSSFIDLNSLSDEAKRELESFYEYLLHKYRDTKKDNKKNLKKDTFKAIRLDTKGFTLNREKVNER